MPSRTALVLALVVFLRLLFLDQAIQGDDVYYLAGAQHAQIDPLHPHHAQYVFQGQKVDMRGHPHPPLNAWILAALLAVFGDVYEIRFHAAYLAFSLVAAASMLSLARRFSPRPTLATLLFVLTPPFLVNGTSLESDLPFLAFWMAGIALFVRAVDAHSRRRLLQSGVALALAALAAYQSVAVVAILGLYLWLHRRTWRAGWATLAVVPLVLAAYQLSERLTSGALPAAVLAGYFQTYGLQRLQAKLQNAAALTAHLGWLVFPALSLLAFRRVPAKLRIAVCLGALALAFADPHPLYWASAGVGLLVLAACAWLVRPRQDRDDAFLAAWLLLFFAFGLVVFHAGAARYLLPLSAPLALLVSRRLTLPRRWLAAGVAAQAVVSLCLALVNYQHWRAYQRFAQLLPDEERQQRVWVNGEWGLRHYTEARGGLPVEQSQAVRPGQMLVSSELAYPVPITTGGGQRVTVLSEEVRPALPFRLIGLGTRSAYSTASFGLRPFDLSFRPLDCITAETVVAREPTLSWLPMSHPDAERHLLSGTFELEKDGWRWTGERVVVLLQAPATARPLKATLFIPEVAPARRITLRLNDRVVAETTLAGPGAHTVESAPIAPPPGPVTVTLHVDRTFQVPGDNRRLGVVLTGLGFE